MATFSNRYSGAQSGTELVAAPGANKKLRVRRIHLSVPNGQNAQVSLGSSEIASTEGSLNLEYDGSAGEGPTNKALTLDSSGDASVVVQYTTVNRG